MTVAATIITLMLNSIKKYFSYKEVHSFPFQLWNLQDNGFNMPPLFLLFTFFHALMVAGATTPTFRAAYAGI